MNVLEMVSAINPIAFDRWITSALMGLLLLSQFT